MSWLSERREELSKVGRDISNLLFIKRTINKYSKTTEWQHFGLESDWFGKIGTVITLTEDEMTEQESTRAMIVQSKLLDTHRYLGSLGFIEIMEPAPPENPPGYRSYKVYWKPVMQVLSVGFVFRYAVYAGLIFALYSYALSKNWL